MKSLTEYSGIGVVLTVEYHEHIFIQGRIIVNSKYDATDKDTENFL